MKYSKTWMIQNFNRYKNTFYNKKWMWESKKKKTFSITLDQLDNFFKSIIGLAQIFEGAKSDFYRLIIEMLNIYIWY